MNELLYNTIFNRGLIPPDKDYGNEELNKAIKELIDIKRKEKDVYTLIKSLLGIKYRLNIYTDDDYTIQYKDKVITYEDYFNFSSLEDIEDFASSCIITPDDGFLRDIFKKASKSIKSGNDYYFSGNQIIELERV